MKDNPRSRKRGAGARSTRTSYDVAIVGLGAMGSAAAYHLSRRGLRVIGFDLGDPPHSLGSTHGESRIIREAYFEDPLYVPIVQRSYDAWGELQTASGESLLIQTGGLLLGPDTGPLIAGTRLSADRHGLSYELYSPRDIAEQFPVMEPDDETAAMWEPRAGILLPEKCVAAHLKLARESGADLHVNEPVIEWRPDKDGVAIKTPQGQYSAAKIVLTPGAWLGKFLPDLNLPLTVERQVLYWYEPAERPDLFELNTLPIFAWEYVPGSLFYGFPNLGSGVKVALHHQGMLTDPDNLDAKVEPEEIQGMQLILESSIPALPGKLLKTEVCMYTNTPDEHFVIDFHPDLSQVLVVSACSGHGFKFAAVIGEIIADLIVDRKTELDITTFRISRLLNSS